MKSLITLFSKLSSSALSAVYRGRMPLHTLRAESTELAHVHAERSNTRSAQCHTTRPLRVVHVVDKEVNSNGLGRLVISGRMADVCEELERLAAREAALSM